MEPYDKLVCVIEEGTYKLEKYKIYTLKSVKYDFKNDSCVRYYNIVENEYRYSPDRFKTLVEHRKEKLNRINENIHN